MGAKRAATKGRRRPAARRPSAAALARAREILDALRNAYPEADCELAFADPFQLLIATILSAQTTDKAVNGVTPALFRRYPDAASLAHAEPADVEPLIASIGLFRNKAKSIVGAARMIVECHGGEVPGEREALESLPGVGRKTANVVLPNAFGVPGLAVDTHVTRVSGRLGLTKWSDPARIEADLNARFDPDDWCFLSHALIWHGRRICRARKPACAACSLERICPSSELAAGGAHRAAGGSGKAARGAKRRGG